MYSPELVPEVCDVSERRFDILLVANYRCTAHWSKLDEDAQGVRRTRKLTEMYVTEFELPQLWKNYGIVGNVVVRISSFPTHHLVI
jgi:hypothetical protein